jgi:hypothetical protein
VRIFVFLNLVFTMIVACVHSQKVERKVAATPEVLSFTSPVEFLPLQPYSCPAGTHLASGAVEVSVDDCLRNYIHRETQHGIIREQICMPSETRHERSLLNPSAGKIYAAVMRNIFFPTSKSNLFVVLKLNQAYYSLQMREGTAASSLSADDVRKAFREVALPQKVNLERCECDLSTSTEQDCLNRLQPLFQRSLDYFVEN